MSTSSELETVVLCVDGSDLANEAVVEGLSRLRPAKRVVVVTVVEASDPTLVTGTGIAGGVLSADEWEELDRTLSAEGWETAESAVVQLGLSDAEIHVLRGDPAATLCSFAREVSAQAIVMGSRGRGGIKRALLGSVSDYVVRNAPCPVVITGPTA